VAAAIGLSLLVSPMLAFTFARAFGRAGGARQAAIIGASMPAAVVTTVLAIQYELDANFCTSVVLFSTLLSPFTLVWLIANLK
jgi:predicted permease